jgi:Flp pilus assembly pilin Flp
MSSLIQSFLREEDGAVVTEYGLLIVVLVMGFIVALAAFRGKIKDWFTNIGANLNNLNSTSSS